MKSQPKYPWCKKVAAKNLKEAMLKKMSKQNGCQDLLLLMKLKFLITITRLQNITVACQLLEVTVADNSNVLWLGHHYQ